MEKLKLQRIGQIKNAEVQFGDLTVLVGPQATGKSIFLQFLRLVQDKRYVHHQLKTHGIDWAGDPRGFLDVYLDEGMSGIWHDESERSAIYVDEEEVGLGNLVKYVRAKPEQTFFYIPAQRVLSLANGWPRPFQVSQVRTPSWCAISAKPSDS